MGGMCPPVGTVYPAEPPMLPAPPPVLVKTSFVELRERGMIVKFFGNDIFGETSLRELRDSERLGERNEFEEAKR